MTRPKTFQHEIGSALISTLLMIVVLTIIVTAFMQSMAVERRTANSYKNKLQAELAAEAGLNLAISKLLQGASANAIVHLAPGVAEEESSIVFSRLDSAGQITSSNPITISESESETDRIHSFKIAPDIVRSSSLYSVGNLGPDEESFTAFYVQDNASKQSLMRFPGPPEVSSRDFGTTLQEVPILLQDGTEMASAGIGQANQSASDLSEWRENLATVATANQIISGAEIDISWADIANLSPLLARTGETKIDLRRLKRYVDGLPSTQTAGNPKSLVVEALLGFSSSVDPQIAWGGGTLEYLISDLNAERYSDQEAKQIVASLIDYIDEDLHPTTDNVDAPTYFGVEGRLEPDGSVIGHPYVTAIGAGLVFNLSPATSFRGQLNSTRVLLCWTLANPWSSRSFPITGTYAPEFTVVVRGTAVGGSRGTDAAAYFGKDTQDRLTERLTNALSLAGGRLLANSGSSFPEAPDGFSFANIYSLVNAGQRQPAGMRFEDIEFELRVARLKFTSSADNSTSYVQVIGTAANPFVLKMNPESFTLPSNGGSVVYNPKSVDRFRYVREPRLNFLQSTWSAGEEASTFPLNPAANHAVYPVLQTLDVTESAVEGEWDGAQGMPSSSNWFTSPNTRKHFFARSPQRVNSSTYNAQTDPNSVAVNSIGEIGYLFTGRPWQTLRMTQSDETRKDFQILDFLDSGTMQTIDGVGQGRLVEGKVNINTASRQTLMGLLAGLSNASDEQKTAITEEIRSRQGVTPYVGSVDYGDLNSIKLGISDKFSQEELLRRVANLTTTRSDNFTIYSYGECTKNGRVISSSFLTATVELFVDSGGGMGARIIQQNKP
jgi:Tfp pilus assembly protein PilX